jgi:hypothetical protein
MACQQSAMDSFIDIPTEITFVNCENALYDEASDATKEDLEEMKAMFREAKRDPTSLWKNFTLPREYFLLVVRPQDEELNQMKAMVQETKQDPMSLYKNFNLPENCLLELSRNFARMQNKSTAASTAARKCTVMLFIK